MGYYFQKMNTRVLQFDVCRDVDKIIFNHYIMRLVNFNNMNGNLTSGHFHIAIRTASSDLNLSMSKIQRLLLLFEELNIIKAIQKGGRGRAPSQYKYITESENNNKKLIETVIGNESQIAEYSDINTLDSIAKLDNETQSDNKDENISETIKKENIKREINITCKCVVDYLNKKTDKAFRHTSKATKNLIKARLSEGFVYEDFCKVIDMKSSQWKYSDMQKFLRPQTLFSDKFEGYLNESPSKDIVQNESSDIENWDMKFDY